MHEREKLAEAERFLTRMEATANDPATFRREHQRFPHGSTVGPPIRQWRGAHPPRRASVVQNAIAGHRLIGFFKKKRDCNVHAEPVVPSNDAAVRIEAGMAFSSALGMVHMNPHGEVLERREPDQSAGFVPKAKRTLEVDYTYYFPEARYLGDVLSACQGYLGELRALVADGLAKAMISG